MAKVEGIDGLSSALARFPAHIAQIKAIAIRDDDFRTLCEDLRDAEAAMQSVGHLPSEIQDGRRAEFADLADSLADEIKHYLAKTNVVQLVRNPGR